ncbi:maltotransferase domain-containing protein, partial [uncultured Aeromicrobium sp.]|uniref:maltotransferase domain-containing protein n=1 Tax=uncultured Aeromicrobium sp. TaxID=337820 RepID=UPI0025E8FE1D
MTDRIGIDDVRPICGDGTYPSKAVVGEHVPVTATVWREGHDAVGATVVWRGPGERRDRATRLEALDPDIDQFGAVIVPDAVGLWTFRVDAWSDPWATITHSLDAKLAAGQTPEELANDLELAARLLEQVAARRERKAERPALQGAADALRDTALPLGARVGPALSDQTRRLMHDHPVRELVTKGITRRIWVDRRRAAFGSWYEFFPRSTGGVGADGKP